MAIYNTEKQRLQTFADWPHRGPPHPYDLAKAGFYHIGPFDQVRCAYCNGELKDWAICDIPIDEHRKHFPNCTFVQQYSGYTGGKPESATPFSQAAVNVGSNHESVSESCSNQNIQEHHRLLINEPSCHVPCPRQARENLLLNHTYSASQTSQNIKTAKTVDYTKEENRLRSFVGWNGKVDKRQLARAGLYYLGTSDRVKCFSCNAVFRDWEFGDDPWIEHAKWHPDCKYLKLCLGEDVVKQIHQHRVRNLPRDVVDCMG